MKSLIEGTLRYLSHVKDDPRRYANNIRQNRIFVVIDDETPKFAPLGWALIARDDAWEHETRAFTSGNAQTTAKSLGFSPVQLNSPLHLRLWDQSLLLCNELTKKHLGGEKIGFSIYKEKPRGPDGNLYYVLNAQEIAPALSPSEAAADAEFEGARVQVTSNKYERSQKNRQACVDHTRSMNQGRLPCAVCDLDFGEKFGQIGTGFIHIHHIDPLGNKQEKHLVDPRKHLVPLCPNCHAMAHRHISNGERPRTVTDLRKTPN